MSTRFIAATIMSAALLLVVLLVALRGCESSPEPSEQAIEYSNTHEETTDAREPVIQYPSVELPETGGLSI